MPLPLTAIAAKKNLKLNFENIVHKHENKTSYFNLTFIWVVIVGFCRKYHLNIFLRHDSSVIGRLNLSLNISSPGACTWKIALKYKVKQSKNGKFTSSYKVSPIDLETQISHRR